MKERKVERKTEKRNRRQHSNSQPSVVSRFVRTLRRTPPPPAWRGKAVKHGADDQPPENSSRSCAERLQLEPATPPESNSQPSQHATISHGTPSAATTKACASRSNQKSWCEDVIGVKVRGARGGGSVLNCSSGWMGTARASNMVVATTGATRARREKCARHSLCWNAEAGGWKRGGEAEEGEGGREGVEDGGDGGRRRGGTAGWSAGDLHHTGSEWTRGRGYAGGVVSGLARLYLNRICSRVRTSDLCSPTQTRPSTRTMIQGSPAWARLPRAAPCGPPPSGRGPLGAWSPC